ncbi:MAG: hypothetical protein ACE5IM_09145 [Nitrospinota bacterium]
MMRRIPVIPLIAFLSFGLALSAPAQSPPPSPGAPSAPPPETPAPIPKEVVLAWAYRARGYSVPKSLRPYVHGLEAKRLFSLEDLKREFQRHLDDRRFQAGWNGIFPGLSKRLDIVKLMGLPDYTETRDLATRWLFRDRKGAKTIVFEFRFTKEERFSAGGSEGKGSAKAGDDPQVAISIRIIPKRRTLASEIRKRFGPPESVEFSEEAILQWKYLRGILVEFREDQKTVDRIIFRINDVLRIG